MIYTIGHRRKYEEGLRRSQETGIPLKKIGERFDHIPWYDEEMTVWVRLPGPPNYPGGYAFRTVEDAQARIDEISNGEYAVFGLEAEWGVDTEQSTNGPWHRLLRDARIVPVDIAPVTQR